MSLMVTSIYFFHVLDSDKVCFFSYHICLSISGPSYSHMYILYKVIEMEFCGVKAFFCNYLHCRDCSQDFCLKGAASPSLCDFFYIYLLT